MNFTFLHAADLHLDSPLIGLGRKSREHAERVNDASRQAFDNMIDLAIQEECRFVLIAGDVFDGAWRDYTTGLFFADRMRRLHEAGIAVFLILGNHDAENKFASRLDLSPNVHLLSQRRVESIGLDELGVVIHGRSFPQRDVLENLALEYPEAVPGRFNIGLLHTACTGRDGHARYAPCTVEQLANHGYEYWALGHVHSREVLATDPYIVFPGNLQGRSARETGPKGATLVRVEDGMVIEARHCPLDVVRWGVETVDVSGTDDMTSIHHLVRKAIEEAYADAGGRALALRLRLVGETKMSHEVVAQRSIIREEIDTIAMSVAADLWVESVEWRTTSPQGESAVDPTIAGTLRHAVDEIGLSPELLESLETMLAEIRVRIPASAHADELFADLRSSAPGRAIELVNALIEQKQG